MTKAEFMEKYTGKNVFGFVEDDNLYKGDGLVKKLTLKPGERTRVRPFGLNTKTQNFTFMGELQEGSAFGQLTWKVVGK
jgi:hypothetical protein